MVAAATNDGKNHVVKNSYIVPNISLQLGKGKHSQIHASIPRICKVPMSIFAKIVEWDQQSQEGQDTCETLFYLKDILNRGRKRSALAEEECTFFCVQSLPVLNNLSEIRRNRLTNNGPSTIHGNWSTGITCEHGWSSVHASVRWRIYQPCTNILG